MLLAGLLGWNSIRLIFAASRANLMPMCHTHSTGQVRKRRRTWDAAAGSAGRAACSLVRCGRCIAAQMTRVTLSSGRAAVVEK